MIIKIHRKKQKPASDLTVSDLNRKVSHSILRKIRIKFHAFTNRSKRFYREYRLPSIASFIFIALLLSVFTLRQLERTSLVALRNEVTEGGNGYSLLLSAEQRDQFIADDTSEDNQDNETNSQNDSPSLTTTQSNTNSFTVIDGSSTPTTTQPSNTGSNTGTSGNTGGGSSGGTIKDPVEEVAPFIARIDSFKQSSVSLQCSNTLKPNKGSCSKVYIFNAGIRSQNGPGTVNYAWQSSIDTGNSTGSYSAGAGQTITSVSKTITLLCTKSVNYTIQFAILSPVLSNSNSINVSHNCNEI